MPFKDLREFIQTLQDTDQIRAVEEASSDLEIGGVTQIALDSEKRPALLFDRINGFPKGRRILTNIISNKTRERLVFGVALDLGDKEAVRFWKDKLKKYTPFLPEKAGDAPVKENTLLGEKVDLGNLPWPRWHEDDGGRCQYGTLVITKDPDSGQIITGTYPLTLVDKCTVTLRPGSADVHPSWRKYWSSGKACPLAISLGQDPTLLVAAIISSSARGSGYELAGWIRGEPVAVTEGVSTGLPIPATAEVVLEGEVLGPEKGQQSEERTVKIHGMLFRNDPIVIGCPPFPKEIHGVLSSNAALIWNDLEALGIPNIVAVNHYEWGCTILAVKQPYPGHVKRVAHAVLGSSAGCNSRVVIVVDEDIDPFNLEKVFWAIATRYEPEHALDIVRRIWSDGIGPREIKDKEAGTNVASSSTIIDACRPYHWMDKFPRTTDISDELLKKTAAKWGRVLRQHGQY